jgi:hypothetical protein
MNSLKIEVLNIAKLCQTLWFVIVTYKRCEADNEILNTNYIKFRLKGKEDCLKCVLKQDSIFICGNY